VSAKQQSIAYLGIEWEVPSLPEADPTTGVVAIVRVLPESPAEKSGARVGDILLAIDGMPVTAGDNVSAMICPRAPGSALSLRVLRGKRRLTLKVTLGERKVAAFKARSLAECPVRPRD